MTPLNINGVRASLNVLYTLRSEGVRVYVEETNLLQWTHLLN